MYLMRSTPLRMNYYEKSLSVEATCLKNTNLPKRKVVPLICESVTGWSRTAKVSLSTPTNWFLWTRHVSIIHLVTLWNRLTIQRGLTKRHCLSVTNSTKKMAVTFRCIGWTKILKTCALYFAITRSIRRRNLTLKAHRATKKEKGITAAYQRASMRKASVFHHT